ncbi:Longin-like domain-containing protein [Xylariomycetidae sp. FL0641]|nr:Longin-like domain-containing protein [Xylariomycetidae sp. FL0641]
MKLYYLGVLNNMAKPAVQLCAEHDLSEFSYFTRGEYLRGMIFSSKTVAERTRPGQRNNIEEKGVGYMVHSLGHASGVAVVAITKEYGTLAAQAVLSQVLDAFLLLVVQPASSPPPMKEDNAVAFPLLRDFFRKFQDPHQASQIEAMQRELHETTAVLHKTIGQLLERGEKLEDLAAKSSDLSAASKVFLKSAKSKNNCCA